MWREQSSAQLLLTALGSAALDYAVTHAASDSLGSPPSLRVKYRPSLAASYRTRECPTLPVTALPTDRALSVCDRLLSVSGRSHLLLGTLHSRLPGPRAL